MMKDSIWNIFAIGYISVAVMVQELVAEQRNEGYPVYTFKYKQIVR